MFGFLRRFRRRRALGSSFSRGGSYHSAKRSKITSAGSDFGGSRSAPRRQKRRARATYRARAYKRGQTKFRSF